MMRKMISTNCNIERFSPSITEGLSSIQVENRLLAKLNNSADKKYSKSYLSIVFGNVFTFFNLLGLIVSLALLYAGASLSNYFYVLIFGANILIGIIQEIRAKVCIDKLSLVAKKKITVIRNGKQIQVYSNEIVLDDIIMLGLGNQIPTDCILLSGNIEVNEALLTGESDAVKKREGDMLYAGSFISSGTCIVRAEKVGKDNYVSQLSEKAKKYKKPQSELMDALQFFIKTIGIIIIPISIAFMLKSTLLYDLDVKGAILNTSAAVIGMIPSGMFLLTSLALAVGIIKLARHNTLVQDLYSLEMLARVNTICFDKTGTITDGKMTVKDVVNLIDSKDNLDDVISSMLYTLKDNNQTALALTTYFGNNNKFEAVSHLPFNSATKLSAVTFKNLGTYVFGAPEFVLCKEKYNGLKDKIDDYASQGLRVLLLGHSGGTIENDAIPTDIDAVALILIVDNIREDAVSTVAWFTQNGVQIKVISGDNPITVSEVSKRVGIPNADQCVSLEGMSDEEVFEIANKYTVFGRVTPEQKAILIKAIKSAGNVTAMTGDGVNDILALKEADCAITVASGSDAARNISHLVLMDNNFNSMPKVVYEGRRVINNVTGSASLYLMKTFFTMILAIITLFLPSYKSYPFQLPQMIMLEVFIIGIPSFCLALQSNDKKVEGKFMASVIAKSLPSSFLMILNVILVNVFRMLVGQENPTSIYTTMSVYAFTFSGLISLYFVCRPINKYRFTLLISSLVCILGITIYANIFGLQALELVQFAPFTKYWTHLLFLICLLLVDIPTMYLLQRLFKNKTLKILPKKLKSY